MRSSRCQCDRDSLTIGRFEFRMHYEPDWWVGGYRWSTTQPPNADDSPEEEHLDFLRDIAWSCDSDHGHAEELRRLLLVHPFEQRKENDE